MITTTNLTIDPEMCKRLDRAIYGNQPISAYVQSKADLYRSEMVDLLTRLNPEIAKKESNHCLYRIYTIIEFIQFEEGKHVNERMHANVHTAHEQLKNWK